MNQLITGKFISKKEKKKFNPGTISRKAWGIQQNHIKM